MNSLKIAFGFALFHILNNLMQMVDVIVVSRLGVEAASGTGVGNSLFATIFVFSIGVCVALDYFASKAFGESDPEQATKYFVATLKIAIILGVIGNVFGFIASYGIPKMGFDPAIVPHAVIYARGIVFTLVPALVFTVCRSWFLAQKKSGPTLWILGLGNLLNLVFDVGLIHGLWGFPRLEIHGAYLATLCVRIVMMVILGVYTYRDLRRWQMLPVVRREWATGSRYRLFEVLKVGLPSGGHFLVEVGIFAFAGVLAARLSAVEGAAHGVALAVASMLFMIPLGISNAATSIVGQAFGAHDFTTIRRDSKKFIIYGPLAMMAIGIVAWACSRTIAGWINPDPRVLVLVPRLFFLMMLFQVFDALQVILAGTLRGVGITRETFLANLLGHWGIALSVALYASQPERLRVEGVWWGLTAGLAFVSAVLGWIWIRRLNQVRVQMGFSEG